MMFKKLDVVMEIGALTVPRMSSNGIHQFEMAVSSSVGALASVVGASPDAHHCHDHNDPDQSDCKFQGCFRVP